MTVAQIDMKSIKIRSKRRQDSIEIRTLITHPMATGRHRNQDTGDYIPEHFIQELTIKLNDKIIIYSTLTAGISKNPFFSFIINEAVTGDTIHIHWLDNLGHKDSAQRLIK